MSPAEAQSELARVVAVDDLAAGAATYPYKGLSADDFERLAYALFNVSAPPGQNRFWHHASIMVRGSDAGRDIALLSDSTLVGVVQCKRLETAIALPAVFRELAKLVLFPLVDDGLPEVRAGVSYYLTLAHDCARTVVEFFDRPTEILKKREADVEAAVREVLESYTTLAAVDEVDALTRVKSTLPRFKYHLLRPVSLDGWISGQPSVSTQFFRHRMVVDCARVDAQYTEIFALMTKVVQQTEGVPLVTDVDLKLINDRIQSVPESHRVSVGLASFFGFPKEMFIGEKNFQSRLRPLSTLLNQLNSDFIDWIFERARKEAADCSVGEWLFTVHPFARQIPLAFLSEVSRDVTSNALSGGVMTNIMSKLEGRPALTTDDERLDHVRQIILEAGRRYLRGDFSEVQGDEALRTVKLDIIKQLMRGLSDEAEMVRHLDSGIGVMRADLFAAASRLRQIGAYKPCVFLNGAPGLDDPKSQEQMAATIRSLEELKRQQVEDSSNSPLETLTGLIQ